MEVILHIDDGPEKGKEFHFHEADNLLIGRQDPTSRAHMNIGPEDPYISRHHFMVEIRPPNCLVRDNGSTNGVFARYKGKRKWERVQECLVNEGDRIRIGKTILSVHVQDVKTETTYDQQDKLCFLEQVETLPVENGAQVNAKIEEKVKAPVFTCIRCGSELPERPDSSSEVSERNFLCPQCVAANKEEKRSGAGQNQADRITCRSCARDVTGQARQDDRADELAGHAFYLCPSCAKNVSVLANQEIGDYLLLKKLGRGGMGEVFQAWHKKTGRVVAIKQLLPMVKVDNEQVMRFMREVQIMNDLSHPGLVRLFESGQRGDSPYFVSEFIPDGNLAQFVSTAGEPLLSPLEAVQVIIRSLEALQILHQNGFVHRDIKPENILVKREGRLILPKLTDFGLARSYERHGGTITKSGECAGTLMFMPPEQVLGFKNSKPPVDTYAMGVTLYFLLTGKYSLKFPTQAERNKGIYIGKDPVLMILEDDPIPVQERRPDLPPKLSGVVNKAVKKESGLRYATAEEFAAELAVFVSIL